MHKIKRNATIVAMLCALVGCGSADNDGGDDSDSPDAISVADGGVSDSATVADTASTDASTAVDSASVDADHVDTGGLGDAAASDSSADASGGDTTTSEGCPAKCSAAQVCEGGKCVAVVTPCGGSCSAGTYCDDSTGTCVNSGCKLPTSWAENTHKLSVFQVAESSQGCDLNGDGKPNNTLGKILKLYPAVNTELAKSIQDGLFNLLLEAPGFDDSGKPFQLNGLLGEVDPTNSACSMTSPWATCKFTVDDDNYKGGPTGTDCASQLVFKPATVKSGELKAGDPTSGNKVIVTLPTVVQLDIALSQVSLHGYPKVDSGKWKETKKAKLCGVITQQDFQKAIDAVPPEAWKQIQLTKEQVTLIINATLQPDIDTNKDGFADAISVAMLLETVPAKISKMTF